jgi:hypothetical protein
MLLVAPLPAALGSVRAMEGGMPRTNLWNQSVPRVELDQRSREARLRLERIERLFVPRAAVTHSRLGRLLGLLSVGIYRGAPQESRIRGPLSDRRPSRRPTILEVWRLEEALP